MRTVATIFSVLIASSSLAGCDDDAGSDRSPPLGGNTGGSIGATDSSGQTGSSSGATAGGAGQTMATAGGVSSPHDVGGTGSTGGTGVGAQTSDSATTNGAGGAATSGASGTTTNGTDARGDSGSSASNGSSGSGTGPEPIIPEITGDCPVFQSGETQIMGLDVNIYAGTPVPGTKGPLLFYWHGTGGHGSIVEQPRFPGSVPAAVKDEILEAGGLIIAPTDGEANREGVDVTVLLSVWFTPGDLKLADLVTACAVRDHNIDPRRIYATGCSAGGLMAGVMALHRSSYVAAAAPNSGGIAVPLFGLDRIEDPDRVPAVITMHGPPETDTVFIAFQDSSRTLNQVISRAGGFAVNCNHGGGHCGAPAELQLAAWRFMLDHPFGVAPKPYAGALPAYLPSYCEIIE